MKAKLCLFIMSIICVATMNASAFTVTLSASQTGTVCQYVTVDFSANIADPNNYSKTAVWIVDGTPMASYGPNTSNAYFVFPNPGAFTYGFATAGTHQVWCEVSSPAYNSGNPVYSDTLIYTITQNEPPQVSIVDVANGNNICVGTLDVFTATPIDAGNPTYTWYVNGIPDLSSTTATFNYTPLTTGVHTVYCVAHSNQACDMMPPINNPDATSNIVIVNVDPCIYYVPSSGTLGPYSTCGGTFYDSPTDPNSNYMNNVNGQVTFCSALPGQYITVQFTSFNTEPGNDILTVYDGNSLAFPILAPAPLSGPLASPPTFTSSVAGGCLTFRFQSNSNTVYAGWVANIFCSPVGIKTNQKEEDAFYIFPNPATNQITIQIGKSNVESVEVYDVLGQQVYNSSYSSSLTIDVSQWRAGIYFVSVKGDKEIYTGKVVVGR